MTKKVYYEKQGRKYVPVSEYDQDLVYSLPKGSHLIMCYPGGQSTRYSIEPNYAAMIAAGRVAEEAICKKLSDASEIKPKRRALTQDELDAWNNLIEVWGDEARVLHHPSVRDIAEAGVRAMMEEADKLLQNPSVKRAYERFLMVAALTKEESNYRIS